MQKLIFTKESYPLENLQDVAMDNTMKTYGMILAAGLSSRMGFYKPLAEIHHKPMICWTIDSMKNGGVEKIIIVTGHNRNLLMKEVRKRYGHEVEFVFNHEYETGNMFDSVLAGLPYMRDADAFYLLLADMPAVLPETFRLLKEKMIETKKEIIIPVMNGRRKHPPLVSAKLIDNILCYAGRDGLRGFWKQEEARILHVEVNDRGCGMDADTPDALDSLRKYLS